MKKREIYEGSEELDYQAIKEKTDNKYSLAKSEKWHDVYHFSKSTVSRILKKYMRKLYVYH